VNRLPKVTGQDQVQVGPDLAKLLQAAEKESIKRGDAFIASELFLLAWPITKVKCGAFGQRAGHEPKEPGVGHRCRAGRSKRGQR
jgi:ATP-dependent Clp protease ATP-binding subunit ClpB